MDSGRAAGRLHRRRSLLRVTEDDLSGLRLVYTPLNGSGRECVEKLLEKLGVQNLTLVPEQAEPDGNFPTCPYPNPEIREAMQKGLELSRIVKPDLLIGTDPDCDRCGVAVPDKGSYRLLSGNEVGVLLLDFICRTRKSCRNASRAPRCRHHDCLHRHGRPHRESLRRRASPHTHRL